MQESLEKPERRWVRPLAAAGYLVLGFVFLIFSLGELSWRLKSGSWLLCGFLIASAVALVVPHSSRAHKTFRVLGVVFIAGLLILLVESTISVFL